MMKLLRFRVTNFRSVDDSGWIETDNVAALIGTNESGKTNLLVPLWKLNPAKDGQIKPLSDYPRKRYNEIRSMGKKPIFIEADFELTDDVAAQAAQVAHTTVEDVRFVNVKKDYDSNYYISFPNGSPIRDIAKSEVVNLFSGT